MNNLYRSSDEKMVAGVCAGLAHRFDLNMTGVRVAVAVLSCLSGFPILVYIALWIILKERATQNVINA